MSSAPLATFLFLLLVGSTAVTADWSLPSLFPKTSKPTDVREIDLKNYCESWRANVEVNNIRGFDVVPAECSAIVGEYLHGGQYKSDIQRAMEEAILYLNDIVGLRNNGRDAWIFDVDEALLSTIPFYEKHHYGAEHFNMTLLEEWMAEGKAPAIEHSLCLYKRIKAKGIKIFLIASRRESSRTATVDNLVEAGFHGWSGLYLRPNDANQDIGSYKSSRRQALVAEGYRIWAVVSSQWSSLYGSPSPLRIFKLPNPLYYEV